MNKSWRDTKGQNLAIARAYVRMNAVYFSPTLYGFVPVPVENLRALVGGPLAVTDKLVLYYEPEWVEKEDVLVLATGLAHEVMHDQLHHVRRGLRYPDPERFNRAADLFVNQALRAQMKKVKDKTTGKVVEVPVWKLAPWFLVPEAYGFPLGLSADQYYNLLAEYESKHGIGSHGKGMIGSGSCGGICGKPTIFELERTLNINGRSDADIRRIRTETTKEIQKALTGRGTIAGAFKEILDTQLDKPVVRWERRLARVTRYAIGRAQMGGSDYSLARPSRRSTLRGWPLPGLIQRELTILVVIDDSGSMGQEQLRAAIRETAGILKQTGIENVYLMLVDAAVQMAPRKISLRDLLKLALPGRGGTDFRPAFEAAKKMKPKPDILIYMTDGDGAAPKTAPREFQTIWCIVPTPYGRRPAHWGELIVVSNDQKLWEPYQVHDAA